MYRDSMTLARAGASAKDHGNGHFSSEAGASIGLRFGEQDHQKICESGASAAAEIGLGGAIVEAEVDTTIYSYEDDDGAIEVGHGYADTGVGIGLGGMKAKARLGVDLVKTRAKIGKNQEFNTHLGANIDTGVEAGVDGVGVKFLGFGFSAGRNTGISTPFGGFSFKLW